MSYSALVIDDDAAMRTALSDLFGSAGWHVTTAHSGKDGLAKIAQNPPDAVVSDVRMPGLTGLDLLAELDPKLAPPIILISAHGDVPMAVQAMQSGAYTFLEKPYDPRRLLSAMTHAAEQHALRRQTNRLKQRLSSLSGLDERIIGRTDALQRLRENIVDFADLNVPVLVQGETGTGKDLVARALHDLSGRQNDAFTVVSCAALTADHFDTTFADLQALSGTLYLDEIASCPNDSQAKLLRLIETLEDRQNLRIIASTNHDLDTAMATGKLREDLLFRVNALTLTLPALRDRADDITLLFTYFAQDYAAAHKVHLPPLSADDLKTLLAHSWPGNIRELRSTAMRYALAARRGSPSVRLAISSSDTEADTPTTLREAVASFERQIIAQALAEEHGTMDDVAARLGIGRRTLNEKIVKLGLNRS